MRRVDAGVDTRGVRVRAEGEGGSRSRLRRAAIEWLERRELLSTLPTPLNLGQSFVGSGTTNVAANSSSPSVAVDPLNPQKLVAAWTTYDPGHLFDGSGGQVTTYVQGAYSIDGGKTWNELPNDTAADEQLDFSVAPVTSGRQPDFAQTTDATVGFGRDESVYLLTSTHNAATPLAAPASGVLDLQKWNFAAATPSSVSFATPTYDTYNGGFFGGGGTSLLNPVYFWEGADAAITPTLAVDNNVLAFGTQSDPTAGNVYVAWETNDAAPKGVTVYNPNEIKLVSSADGGNNFTYQAYLDNSHASGATYDSPKIAISQGSGTVQGGKVTIVYDDAGEAINGPAPYFDAIDTQADTNGGTDVDGQAAPTPIQDAVLNGIAQGTDQPGITTAIIKVPTLPSNFSLANLTLTLGLEYANLNNTSAVLTSPNGVSATLWNNATNDAGAATNAQGTITGANIGDSALTEFIGTTLDSTAFRSLFDGNVSAPYQGHFRPLANLQTTFAGLTPAQLSGNWKLTITDFRNVVPPTGANEILHGASLDLTAGLNSVTDSIKRPVATSFLNSGLHPFTDAIQGQQVDPNPSIASDNTLGTSSPHQGRLYIAFTNDDFNAVSKAYTNSTFIQLYFSDDGGATWLPDSTDAISGTRDGIVNDDDGQKDGFSTGGFAQPNTGEGGATLASGAGFFPSNVGGFLEDLNAPEANVRPKMEPQVEVDPDTGTVVVSYLDTRNDAAEARTATYIAASTDGGQTFAPQTYANPTSPAINAITGGAVNLGPVPDNESGGNAATDAMFGFGQHQGLAVENGTIIPVWSSNQNAGSNLRMVKVSLNIESADLTFADGPRVIASTQGPVGEPGDTVNTQRAADGTPIANTIVLTFDRAVDPTTFLADAGSAFSSPLQVFYNNPSGVGPVQLHVLTVSHNAADTIYTVTFDPAGNGVGTYTYALKPLVKGMIPYQSVITVQSSQSLGSITTAIGTGVGSETFTSSGHGTAPLTGASLTAFIDIISKGASNGSSTDLQVFLRAADGTTFTLFSGTTLFDGRNEAIPLDPAISIPAGEPLDQTYTIIVKDSVPNEQVVLFGDANPSNINFQAAVVSQSIATTTGNLLDQNGDGTPGEATADLYSIPDGRNTLPLIVPGPHVVNPSSPTTAGGVSVVGVNGTVSTGPDNLVNNDNANAVSVTFDRTIQVSSFTPAQVLSVVGPTGRIDGPQVFPSTGTTLTFPFNGSYELIPVGGTLVSTIPILGNAQDVSNLSVQLNITDPNDKNLAIVLVAPDGTMVPLVAAGSASGANFTNTTFSDFPAANGLSLAIPSSAAPYSLTYKPASPLGALAGKAIEGNWKLMITDSSPVGSPQGRLNAWSLVVTPEVPEGPGSALDSTLVVPGYADGSFTIAHLAVQLNISSTKDSDLQVSLIKTLANGTKVTVPLVAAGAASGVNFANTTFDDGATIPIGSGAAPYSLTYRPSGPSPLSTFDGLSINGTWTLQITNPNADGSVTTLNSWSLIATPQLTVTPVNASNGGATTFKIKFPTQTLSGTYTVTLSPTISSVAANPASPGQGTPLDTDLNAGVNLAEGIATGGSTPSSYPATAVPVAIPYATTSAVGSTNTGTLVSQINVPDNFAIQGDGALPGLTVSLNISYYNDPDLTATLTAPDGKTITLFMNVGVGGNTANFTNTTLSDVTSPLAPISQASAPFFGTFNPESAQGLAAFMTDNSGNQAFSQGLWTLTITNRGLDPGSSVDAAHPPQLLSWALNFQRPQTSTGLGEAVADRKTVSFRLFNIAPTNPLANDTWTAVGPAGTSNVANGTSVPLKGLGLNGGLGGVNLAGPVTVTTIDPADPSGNTAYVGASSGGIWKTTNFLTTSAGGPTYVPLTDFGTNYSINIGSIAIFDQNNDTNQSLIFAGTGDGQATTANSGNAADGVGILRSTNGGASFVLLDSSTNVDANGNPLPEDSPLRDHIFVGTTTYKLVVDPTQQPGGGVIVYAALGGKNGGLWRTTDGGNHWTNLSGAALPQVNGQNAAATDVLLDPASASASTGNLNIVYAAFEGVGVFISSNQGQSFNEVLGNVGADNLIQNDQVFPGKPLTVPDASPNNSTGRIILAKPALTGSKAENILYQDWLYAAVENANGTFNGLYVTKDRGENWTKADIADMPTPTDGNAFTQALPTNDNTQKNNYDVTNPPAGNGSGGGVSIQNGNSAFSMTIDPLNPQIIYLGGTQNYQDSGLIRVDITGIHDAHDFVPFSNSNNDGGELDEDAAGSAIVNVVNDAGPFFEGTSPGTGLDLNYYTNLRHAPNDPFNVSATLFVFNSSGFTNDGTGVAWEPIDAIYGAPLDGSTNIHQIVSEVDPRTGLTRLIISDDEGVFTGVYNADGSLDAAGNGTDAAVTGSRNGNLQDEEIYFSAAQPSALAASTAGALFYGSGIGEADLQSSPTLLSTGNLTWTDAGTGYGDLQGEIETNDRNGTGIATDQTGGVSASSPNGSPALYEYDEPLLGGDTTNFFRVQNKGATFGLTNQFATEFPGTNVLSQGNGVTQLGNFTVNPINGSQILIGSNLGNVYQSVNQGEAFLLIGAGEAIGTNKADFDGTYPAALTYGAPDPSAPNGVGNLNNFIYVGTEGGNIYVTRTGGSPWTQISAGLDGSSVVGIYTDPNRGTHDAYAITLKGVYYMANSVAPGATWVNITGNLTQIQHNAFGDPTQAESALLPYANGQFGGFRSIVADFRYAVPDPVTPGVTYPVLYVAGYGGVFRSLDNGGTWTLFPNTSFDSAPVDGGYLPNVDVTSLSLNLGAINPATGHPGQVAGDPEVLLASTLGRGDFAIRLAPDVFPSTIHLDTTQPVIGLDVGSDSGVSNSDRITNVPLPVIDGNSEISNYGNTVTITITDPNHLDSFGHPIVLAVGSTDQFGNFTIPLGTGVKDSGGALLTPAEVEMSDPLFFASSQTLGDKVLAIQATDSAGASGNQTLFLYTLDLITPATPGAPLLTPPYVTGRPSAETPTVVLTDLSDPAQAGPGAPLTFTTAPVFSVTTAPTANPLVPNPVALTVELFRYTVTNGVQSTPILIASATGGSNAAASTVTLTDANLQALVQAGPLDQTFFYYAVQVDTAGNTSPLSPTLSVTVDTIAPAAPSGLSLVTLSNVTPPQPVFNAVGVLPGDQLFLYRSLNGSPAIQVGVGPINTGSTAGTFQVADTKGAFPDGNYTYYAVQQDVYGNFSPLGTGLPVTINTQAVPRPPVLLTDTGRSPTDDITDIEVPAPTPGSKPAFVAPTFSVVAGTPAMGQPAVATIELFRSSSPNGPFVKVGTAPFSGNLATPTVVSDASLAALAAAGTLDQYFYYEADQVNASGIESNPSAVLPVFVTTVIPTALPAPTLDPNPANDTGLVPSQNIINITHPTFDATGLLAADPLLNNAALGDQLLLYRSTGGSTPILVGTGPINTTGSTDTATLLVTDSYNGPTPDGVYLYSVAQRDIAGNVSPLSVPVTVTINTTVPAAPTISLLNADDSGLPSHPNVTNVNTPRFVGLAQYNAPTNFPVSILIVDNGNDAAGRVIATTFPAANGTYLAQVTSALPDGVYTLVARTTNLAGTNSYSAPISVTIHHNGPQIIPTLSILPADDTGLKGDGVTANHNPRFTGVTDKGDTVSLYAIVNGQLQGPEATTTSSTINGTFTFSLPFNLSDGTTQLVAQTSDVANNKTPLTAPYTQNALTVQIVTVPGDYLGIGAAQLTVFDPATETYFVRNVGLAQVDTTPGRDVPVQYDFNGDGLTDLSAYRFNTAEYFGYLSNGTANDYQYGFGGASLPVSGYYGTSGTFLYGEYNPQIGQWILALPQAGGLTINFGVPKLDIPTPAAFNGLGQTEIAVFRPSNFFGNDADSFTVFTPGGNYLVSFTSPAVAALGFKYQPGDIPAPADYDGVGRDEFAVYRPSTGQFFILNTPNFFNPSSWTLRTVTLNLPGGPSLSDVPASEDYDGNGKIDPTVFRPSNSTFYLIHSSTGIQENIQFGPPNAFMAAAGPLLYRLTALKGAYATAGGYSAVAAGFAAPSAVHAESIAPATTTSTASASTSTAASSSASHPATSPITTMIALAAPVTLAPTTPTSTSSPSPVAALGSASASKFAITVGAPTPKATGSTASGPKSKAAAKAQSAKAASTRAEEAHLAAESRAAAALAKSHAAKAAASAHHAPVAAPASKGESAGSKALNRLAVALPALQGVVAARKGRDQA